MDGSLALALTVALFGAGLGGVALCARAHRNDIERARLRRVVAPQRARPAAARRIETTATGVARDGAEEASLSEWAEYEGPRI